MKIISKSTVKGIRTESTQTDYIIREKELRQEQKHSQVHIDE